MADLKISQLPDAAVPLGDEDYIPVVQGLDTNEPSTNKVRVSELKQAVEDDNVVHKTGDETIGGEKLFTEPTTHQNGIIVNGAARFNLQGFPDETVIQFLDITTGDVIDTITNSDFADFKQAVISKADDNDVMHLSGDKYENVTGQKNFNGYVVFNSGAFFGDSGAFTSDSDKFYISALNTKNLTLRTENTDISNPSSNIELNGVTGITSFNKRYEAQTINAIFDLPVQGVDAVAPNQLATLGQIQGAITKEIKSISSTTYTIVQSDINKTLHFTANTDVSINVDTSLTINSRFEGIQIGDGQLIFTNNGATVVTAASETNKTAEKYSAFALDYIANNVFVLYGKLELV
ncbi:hypothetical protein [Pedobacter glucosidilyticus]|uniref:hypothetical protein n=1 Tax=Pedobacter glucosidilyticus TaxID=1122941 RepID=UPI0004000369|nr:hypothetical protein [Pedobacter glucosidilyticus]